MADDRDVAPAVIDDDQSLQNSLEFPRKTFGYKLATFPSATAFPGERAFRPACPIVDQHMPRMTVLQRDARLYRQGVTFLFRG